LGGKHDPGIQERDCGSCFKNLRTRGSQPWGSIVLPLFYGLFLFVMATDFLSQVSFPLVHFYTYSKSFHTSEIPTQTPAPVNTTHSIPSVVCSNTSTMITSPYPPTPICLFSRTLRWPPRLGEAQELRIRPQSVQELSVILTPELTRTLWKRSRQRWQRE